MDRPFLLAFSSHLQSSRAHGVKVRRTGVDAPVSSVISVSGRSGGRPPRGLAPTGAATRTPRGARVAAPASPRAKPTATCRSPPTASGSRPCGRADVSLLTPAQRRARGPTGDGPGCTPERVPASGMGPGPATPRHTGATLRLVPSSLTRSSLLGATTRGYASRRPTLDPHLPVRFGQWHPRHPPSFSVPSSGPW